MHVWADQQRDILKSVYEDEWDIWYVPKHPNAYTWCAKPAGTPIAEVNADSPQELINAIVEWKKNHADENHS